MTEDEITALFDEPTYSNFVRFENGEVACLCPYLFTTAILSNVTKLSYMGRWCFKTREEALEALKQWDGVGHPSGEWTRGLLNNQKFILENGQPVECPF